MKKRILLPLSASLFLAATSGYAESLDPVHQRLIPVEKGETLEALLERESKPVVWQGPQLNYIGMPVSGIGTGQVQISGDGRLWYWDVFNGDDDLSKNEGMRYQYPSKPEDFSPIKNGFVLHWKEAGQELQRSLDASGFREISFKPEFPVAKIAYRDPEVPLEVDLTAFTPYIPTNLDDSTYPATVFEFTVHNSGTETIEAEVSGFLGNFGAEMVKSLATGTRTNRLVSDSNFGSLVTSISVDSESVPATEEAIVFEDFNGDDFDGWTATGEAFGPGPEIYDKEGHLVLRGTPDGKMAISVRPDDGQTGSLISDPFIVSKPFINLSIVVGRNVPETGVRLLVDGKVVRHASGTKPRKLIQRSWNVTDFIGKEARIEFYDFSSQRGYGFSMGDHIEFSNLPFDEEMPASLLTPTDLGELGLAVVGAPETVEGSADLTTSASTATAQVSLTEELIGSVGRKLALEPGESQTVSFVLSWRFPHRVGRQNTYTERWPDIQSQLEAVISELPELSEQTLLFADTWRDSTLPYWLLNRIIAPAVALNTRTVNDMGGPRGYRFILLEGSGNLGGNCTHVWHYAQAAARLFPEIERLCREQVELRAGLTRDGLIKYRAVPGNRFMSAVDGSSGTILRVLREHKMSTDNTFLERVWPKTKRAMQYLIKTYDPDKNGITAGWQHHTLDQKWAGDIPWLTSMYLSALAASAEMADLVGDSQFAAECRGIVEKGRTEFIERMWSDTHNYFIMQEDTSLKKPSNGTFEGVHIDQVLGEWWLTQVGMEPILDPDKTRAALEAIFRYNYTPDVGPYREEFSTGRWYAVAGEPGLLMATFPYGGMERVSGHVRQSHGYLNECMTGFEWQAAGHMIEAGLVREGLQVVKALDERYAPEKRNPYNEIECGDHYSRAMASYSVLINLSGYDYDGPAGYLAFAPKVTPENFRTPFTVAEGWGTYSQQRDGNAQVAELNLRYGTLRLNTFELEYPGEGGVSVSAEIDGKVIATEVARVGHQVAVTFEEPLIIEAGSTLILNCKMN